MGSRDAVSFREIQPFRQWRTGVILAFPPAAMLFIAVRQLILHKPWGSPPMSNGGVVFLTVLLVGVYFRLMTVKLITEVRPGEVVVGLRGLWKRRRIPLDQIRSAGEVTYDAVADFGGYGIRSGRRAYAYIARGNRGVEVVLKGGQKILIGSQTPSELADEIRQGCKR